MDTVGAFGGPLLAILLMSVTHNNFRLVFWIAAVPALISVLLIVFGVEEPESAHQANRKSPPISFENLSRLSANFWRVVIFAAVLALARFSEAFLLLRAQGLGLPVAWVPMVLIVMNVVYAISAYPFGKLSDNGSRPKVLAWGIVFLIIADLMLAVADNVWIVFLGTSVWGLHMGATQGLLSTLVADAAPAHMRGTAFGVFNLASGVALLAASVIAGGLWAMGGPAMTFYAGAAFSTIALAGLLVTVRRKK